MNEVAKTGKHWSSQYLGIPATATGSSHLGCSCYGLVALVYREQKGIELPLYEDIPDAAEIQELQALINGTYTPSWVEIKAYEVKPFDLVTFQLRGCDSHVGIVTHRNHMLHMSEKGYAKVDMFTKDLWLSASPRFFRHSAFIENSSKQLVTAAHAHGLKVLRTLGDVGNSTEFTTGVVVIPEGATIEDAVKLAFPKASQYTRDCLRITIGADIITQDRWHIVRPLQWDYVVIRVVPKAAGILRIIMSLVVMVAAAAVSAGALGPAGLGIAGSWLAAGSFSATAAAAVIGIGGNLLINALIPVKMPKSYELPQLPVYSIGGFQNALNADGPVPTVLGQIRFAPPYAALPYTENVNDARYAVALFLVGYGPIEISDLYIGNTPISNYQDIQIEIRQGYESDPPITLYTKQVIEDADNMIRMDQSVGYQYRHTAKDVTSAECEYYFFGGLIGYTTFGSQKDVYPVAVAVAISIQYRKLGTSTWVEVGGTTAGINPNSIWRCFKFDFPERGTYEIRSARLTPDLDDVLSFIFQGSKYVSKFEWSALRSFRPEAPLNYTKPMALIAIRVKASGQLSGQLQNLSVMARRICPDWDTPTQTWITRATSNPASLYRYVHQGPENAYPKADNMLDLQDIQDWGDYCTANGLEYNAVHQTNESQDSVLDAVASAGRALRHDRGDKHSIIIDRPREVFDAFITPANSRNFKLTNPKVVWPDAFSVTFSDQTNLYRQATRIIPWPNHTGDIRTIQEIQLPGKTNPDEVWIEARRKMYEAMLRQNSYTVDMDQDDLNCVRGSAVYATHYITQKSQHGGYVIAVLGDSSERIRIDTLITMEEGKSYQCRLRHADNSTTVRKLVTLPGQHSTLLFADTGTAPAVNDLVMVGEVTAAELELLVKGIEYSNDSFSSTLTLIPHAPTLDYLAAAEVPPVWDGLVGGDGGVGTDAPAVPVIGTIISGAQVDPIEPPYKVFIPITSGSPIGAGPTVGFEVSHRLVGADSWTIMTVGVSEGGATISTYAKGDNIEVKVRAFGAGTFPLYSTFTDTVTHTVAANDPTSMQITAFTVTQINSTTWRYTYTLNIQPAGGGIRIKYRTGHYTTWADLTSSFGGVITSSPYESSTPTIVDSTEYSFGAIALDPSGVESGTPIILQVTTGEP
jgi:hypothetical protein